MIEKLNSYGVPIPIMRVDGKPSITATMTILSFTTALIGQAGKVSGFFGTIDLTQANYLFGICLAGYLGRKAQLGAKGAIELSAAPEAKPEGDKK